MLSRCLLGPGFFISTLLESFGLAILVSHPFLHSSGRVNHVGGVVAGPGQASLELLEGRWLAPLHGLEGLLLVRAQVAPRLWWVKQLDNFLLQGSLL